MPISYDEYLAKFGSIAKDPTATGSGRQFGWGDRFGAAVDRAQGQLYGVGEAIGLNVGDERRSNQAAAEFVRQRAIEDTGAPQSFRDIDGVGSLGRFVGGMAVDSAPELLLGVATGGLGAAAGLGTAARLGVGALAQYPLAAGDVLQNQREESGHTNAPAAFGLAVPYTALEMAGLEGALARGRMLRTGIRSLDEMQGVRGALARTGANAALNFATEGTTETGQELVNQFGRMAVNPNQTLFNEDANERYLESFVGGGLLGGAASTAMGGWRRSAGYQAPQPVDLIQGSTPNSQSEQSSGPAEPILGLGYSPLAGTPVIFPDGSVALNSEQELQARFPNEVEPVRGLNTARVGQVSSPVTINVDPAGTAATTYDDTVALTDPGAELARQRYLAQRQQQQEVQRIEQEKRQELASLNEELGLQTGKYRPQHVLLKSLQALRAADAVTAEQYAEQVALLRGDKPLDVPGVRRFVKDIQKTRDAKQTNAAAARAAAPAEPAPVREAPPTPQVDNVAQAADVLLNDAPTPAAAPATPPSQPVQPAAAASPAPGPGAAPAPDPAPVAAPTPSPAAVSPAPVAPKPTKAANGDGDILTRVKAAVAEKQRSVVLGNDINWSALKDILEPLDARMHHAVRLALGVDKDGNRLDKPMSMSGAAQKAGIGKSHDKVSKVMTELGLTKGVRQRFTASSAQANERAEGSLSSIEDAVPDTLRSEVEAELNQFEDDPEAQRTAALADVGENDGKGKSSRKSVASDVSDKRGLVTNQSWYKTLIVEGGPTQANDETLVTAAVKVVRYKDSPENRAALDAILAEVNRRQRDPEFVRLLRKAYDKESGDVETTKSLAEDDGLATDAAVAGYDETAGDDTGVESRQGAEEAGVNREDSGGDSQGKAPVVVKKKRRRPAPPAVLENIERLTAQPSVYAGERQRAPSLRRQIAQLQKLLDRGSITADAFAARVELAMKMSEQDRAPQPRERGADYIRQRLLESKRRGELSERAVEMAEWFILKNPALVEDLAISIRSSKEDGASGSYNPLARLMTLIKESSNDETTVHEILHHLERMMPLKMQDAIRKSWLKSLTTALDKAAPGSKEHQVLKAILDYHLNDSRASYNSAIKALKDGDVAYELYQYVNPSEFWAVNGSRILEGRFDAKGSLLGQMKQWLREFAQKIKAVFGLPSDAAVLRALDSVVKGDGQFVTGQGMLLEGAYENIKGLGRDGEVPARGGADTGTARLISRAAKRYSSKYRASDQGGKTTYQAGKSFGPYKGYATHAVKDADGDYHLFVFSKEGVLAAFDYLKTHSPRPGVTLEDVFAEFAGQHLIYFAHDGSNDVELVAPAVGSWAADELRQLGAFSVTDQFWDGAGTQPVTRMEGVSLAQAVDAMGEFLAFIKAVSGQEKVPVNWERITGANIGKKSSALLNIERPAQSTVQKNVAKLPRQAQPAVRNSLSAIADAGNKALDLVVFTNDLVKRAVAAGMKSAQTFQGLLVQRAEVARTKEEAAQKIADMYASVPQQDRGRGERSVNSFLFESTRTGKWGYGKDADPEMAQWFNSLQKPTQEFVKVVFAHGDAVLAEKKKAVLDFTTSEYDERIAQASDDKTRAELENDKKALLKRFSTLFAIREGKPYAPIKRTGDYVVIAKSKEYLAAEAAEDTKRMAELEKDEDHYQVSFTQGKMEARRLSERLAATGRYPAEGVYLRQRDKHQDSLYGGDGVLKSLAKLRSRVENSEDKTSGKLLRMVSDLYLEALAEDSARKSEMRRRGIAGEVDMLASFAQQGKADANFMASVQFTQPIQDSIRAMTREMQDARDDGRASELRNELLARYEQVLDRKDTPLLDKVTRLSSIWFLATSPGYYMQNLTQPFMMSLPAMTARHDYTKAAGAFFEAYGQLKDIVNKGLAVSQQFDLSKVPEDVRDAIEELTKRGKIDIGMDADMGEFQVEGRGPIRDRWNKIDRGLRHAVQKIETINRISTAMAAYRLELAKTGDKTLALDYADKILTETHGDYTAFNAPRVFNTAFGKISLQFRKFQLIQLSYYAKLINDIASNPQERRAALKALTYSLGHLAVFAGVRGLPGFAAVSWVLSKLLGDDDEPYDLERQIRQAIGDPAIANLVMRGTPTLAGLDLSGKIGAGNALSILPFSNADLSTSAGRYQAFGELVGGAAGGMTMRFLDGVGLMASGEWYRGLERTLPKGLSDALVAAREARDGMTRLNGDLLLSPEEMSWAGTFWNSLGLQSSQKSVVYEQQQRVRAMDQNFQDRSTRIRNDYVKAARERDSEAMAEARQDWARLQEARARNGYTKQPLSSLLKAPQEQAKRERNTAGGVQFNRNNAGFVRSEV